jgi:hypothetical protein
VVARGLAISAGNYWKNASRVNRLFQDTAS